jgi:enediyne biosynthesis protein E4
VDWRRRVLLAIAVIGAIALAVVVLAPRSVTPEAALGAPRFVDETASAGIEHTYDGDFTFAVGGGVAVFDCDGDGRPDLYIAGGARPAALFHNESPIGGALQFSRLSSPVTDLESVNGAYPIDIDGDGVTDLVVLRNGESVLLRGLGDCQFARANELWGARVDGMTEAFSATWETPDRPPTLAFGRYLEAGSYDCDTSVLVRPGENGWYGQASVLEPGYCALSMLFSDWDRSGRRDLRVSNDRQYYTNGQEQLWRMQADGAPRLYTADDGWVSVQIWGMGIASFDLLGSGFPEVFLTSQGDNKLQTLTVGPSQPTYRDIALKRGVLATQPFAGGEHLPSTAWHPEFQDVNNDGFIDLFISKGNVGAQAGYATRDPSNLLIGQVDGTFKEGADSAGVMNFARGRGAALADFNLDGMLDLVEVNYGDAVRIWRNVGTGDAARPVGMGNWLGLRLVEPGANRDAIGAWVEVQVGSKVMRRELTVGGGHASGELGWIHFGLGPSRTAQVRVQWPDGEVGAWRQVDANQYLVLAP